MLTWVLLGRWPSFPPPSAACPATLTCGRCAQQYLNGTSESANNSFFTVRLTSQPILPVTVNFTTDAQLSVALNAVVFDHTDWDIPKNLSMVAVDDYVDEDYHIGVVVLDSESDPINYCYSGLRVSHRQIIEDNDCAGLAMASELLVSESDRTWNQTLVFEATAPQTEALTPSDQERVHEYLVQQALQLDSVEQEISYSLTLTSQPVADVSVHLVQTGLCERCSRSGQLLIVPSALFFTPANWNETQYIQLLAVDDDTVESLASDMSYQVAVRHTSSSADPKYHLPALSEMTVCEPIHSFSHGTPGRLDIANATTLAARAVPTANDCARLCTEFGNGTACASFDFGGAFHVNGARLARLFHASPRSARWRPRNRQACAPSVASLERPGCGLTPPLRARGSVLGVPLRMSAYFLWHGPSWVQPGMSG